ncbi:DUF2169 domain-containing protein [Sphaerotilus sulfidivorans]
MEFINATRMAAGFSMGLEPSGRELLVVVLKGTFCLPEPGQVARLHAQQVPLMLADTFTGMPGFAAPVHEADYAPRKPACDVLLLGSAHAPGGRPVARTSVLLRVGPMTKRLDVVGDRVWQAGLSGIHPSDPHPFLQKIISYDVAFGGVDQESADPADHGAYLPNPIGRGYRRQLKNEWVDGRPLPNTEAVGQPVRFPTEPHVPMAFGPVGRSWMPRARWAGTYDQAWLDEVFPFLPRDFDERHYQAAAADQQMPVPTGPLEVTLAGLTADGLRQFMLPYFDPPVHVHPRRGEQEVHTARLDTVVFEPDLARFTMSWRVTRPLKSGLHELAQVVVGAKGRQWWQQREQLVINTPVPSGVS